MIFQSSEFAFAITHVLKGVVRTTSSNKIGERHIERTSLRAASLNERQRRQLKRRQLILEQLYKEHAVLVDAASDALEILPPDPWVNSRLLALREAWRVHNVDGFRCEIYDV